jgi:hypothetical protein
MEIGSRQNGWFLSRYGGQAATYGPINKGSGAWFGG